MRCRHGSGTCRGCGHGARGQGVLTAAARSAHGPLGGKRTVLRIRVCMPGDKFGGRSRYGRVACGRTGAQKARRSFAGEAAKRVSFKAAHTDDEVHAGAWGGRAARWGPPRAAGVRGARVRPVTGAAGGALLRAACGRRSPQVLRHRMGTRPWAMTAAHAVTTLRAQRACSPCCRAGGSANTRALTGRLEVGVRGARPQAGGSGRGPRARPGGQADIQQQGPRRGAQPRAAGAL
jgi:hypothetical protein